VILKPILNPKWILANYSGEEKI